MSANLQLHELEKLMDELDPDQIQAEYGSRMKGDVLEAFVAFRETCCALDALPKQLAQLVSPMPEQMANHQVVPFPARRMGLPTWTLPFAAAALILIGWSLPRQVKPVASVPNISSTRSAEVTNLPEFNYKIGEAFLLRAQALQGRREFELAWHDYQESFTYLSGEKAQRQLILDEMTILAEELADTHKKEIIARLRKENN